MATTPPSWLPTVCCLCCAACSWRTPCLATVTLSWSLKFVNWMPLMWCRLCRTPCLATANYSLLLLLYIMIFHSFTSLMLLLCCRLLKDVLSGNNYSIMIAHSLMLLLCCMQLKDVLLLPGNIPLSWSPTICCCCCAAGCWRTSYSCLATFLYHDRP